MRPATVDLQRIRRDGNAECRRILDLLVVVTVCPCVVRWPGAVEYVADAEGRFDALLRVHEVEGGNDKAEIEAAAVAVLDAWRTADTMYDARIGDHSLHEPQDAEPWKL